MDFAAKRAALVKSHEAALAKLDDEAGLYAAFAEAGLRAPDFVCMHGSHASVGWYPPGSDGIGDRKNFSIEDAISELENVEPFLLNMDPARDGRSLSLWPARLRKGDKWAPDGVPFAVELRQHLFGEVAGEMAPRYRECSLSVWVLVGGLVVNLSLKLSGVPDKFSVYWMSANHRFHKPAIPGSRLVSYGVGGHSADVRYLFQGLADVREALCAKAAA
jgi:hypothetical protein